MAASIAEALRAAEGKAPAGWVPPKAQGVVDPNMALEPKGAKTANPLKLTPGKTGVPEAPGWTTSKGFAPAGPNSGPQVAMGAPNQGPQIRMGAPNQGPQVGMGAPNQGPHTNHMGGPNVGPQPGMGPNAGPQLQNMGDVRNPNVGRAPVPPVPPDGPTAKPLGASGGPNVPVGAGQFGPAAAGFLIQQAGKGVGAPTSQFTGPITIGPEAASRIPTDTGPVNAPAREYNFWRDTETGRNLNNLSNASAMIPAAGALAATGKISAGVNSAARSAHAVDQGFALGNLKDAYAQKPQAITAVPATAKPTPPIAPSPDQRVARNRPGASGESLKGAYGDFSPAGTFGDGYTDMGGGIAGKGSGSRGQFNDFTNIGVNGQPVPMSTRDSRTPDQIANAARINADTAKFVAQREQERRGDPYQNALNAAAQQIGIPLSQMTPRTMALATQMAQASTQAQVQTAGDRMRSADTRRGQDIQLETAALPERLRLEAAQRQREAIGQAFAQAEGDPGRMAKILMGAGYADPAKNAMDYASAETAQTKNVTDVTRNLLAPMSIVRNDKNEDVVSPALQARNEGLLRQMVANYDQLSAPEQAAAMKQYAPALNVLNGMNERRKDTLGKAWGLDQSPEISTLPSAADLAGARMENVGLWEGWTTPGAEIGDTALRLPGGQTRYINKDRMTEAEQAFLASRGVKLGKE